MTWFDYAVVVIVVWSALLGWWRGLVCEALSLLGWVAAYALARWQAANVAELIPANLGTEETRITVAFAVLFVATLIASGVVVWLLSKLTKLTGLGWLDGLLGGLFGILRGALLVLVFVVLGGLTELPKKTFWREAKFSQPVELAATRSLPWLPDSMARHIHFGLQR